MTTDNPRDHSDNQDQLLDDQDQPRDGEVWQLRLYVAGVSPKSVTALDNLKRICEENLRGKYQIQVIDVLKNPQLAAGDQILALPTLVRHLPPPIRKIIGDLSNTERVLIGLNIRSRIEVEQP